MKETRNRHSIDIFFVLCLFLICTISLLGMLFMGAKTYQKINRNTQDNFSMRTSLLYISNKAKSFQEQKNIRIGSIGQEDALIFEEEINGITYTTQVYAYDGYLMELFAEKNCDIGVDAGTIITEVSSVDMQEKKEGLIEISVVSPNGKKGSVIILAR